MRIPDPTHEELTAAGYVVRQHDFDGEFNLCGPQWVLDTPQRRAHYVGYNPDALWPVARWVHRRTLAGY